MTTRSDPPSELPYHHYHRIAMSNAQSKSIRRQWVTFVEQFDPATRTLRNVPQPGTPADFLAGKGVCRIHAEDVASAEEGRTRLANALNVAAERIEILPQRMNRQNQPYAEHGYRLSGWSTAGDGLTL
jgi:hypothetical protein